MTDSTVPNVFATKTPDRILGGVRTMGKETQESTGRKKSEPRPKQSSYLKSTLQQLGANVKDLQAKARSLELSNQQLQSKLEVLPLLLAEVEQQIQTTVFSRQAGLLQFHQDKFMASVGALPPPSLWTAEIFKHLETLGVEEYRYLLNDALNEIRLHVPEALRHGQGHPSYDYVLELEKKVPAIAKYCMRMNPNAVVKINLHRNLLTGDCNDTPSDAWWDKVATCVPLGLFSPQRKVVLLSCTEIYLPKMRKIQKERERLRKVLAELIPLPEASFLQNVGYGHRGYGHDAWRSVPLHGSFTGHQPWLQQGQVYREADSWKIQEVLDQLEAQDAQEAIHRATLLGVVASQVFTPLLHVCVAAACYPYTPNIPALLTSFRKVLEAKEAPKDNGVSKAGSRH